MEKPRVVPYICTSCPLLRRYLAIFNNEGSYHPNLEKSLLIENGTAENQKLSKSFEETQFLPNVDLSPSTAPSSKSELDQYLDENYLIKLNHPQIARIDDPIWKLPSDNRTYLSFELKNGVRMFFINNPDSIVGAFSISFETGFFFDPVKLQGLAHFHEHMVSMGTKLYPGHMTFKTFIDLRGGSGNAETTTHAVTHWNFIEDKYIVETARRYRDFFRSPLFPSVSFERELFAIQSELVQRKAEFPVLITLVEVLVKRNHYASKTGVGHERIVDRVLDVGVEHVRAQLCVFQARQCIGPKTNIAVMLTKLLPSHIYEIIDLFADMPVKPATTLADMEPYIENAGLDPKETEAALAEQIEEPFIRTPESAQSGSFNYSNCGSILSVVKPSATNLEFVLAFPMEDFGAWKHNGTITFAYFLLKHFSEHVDYPGRYEHEISYSTYELDQYLGRRSVISLLKVETGSPTLDMDLPIKIAELLFETIGNALRQTPSHLELFVRNSTLVMDAKPRPPHIEDAFIQAASKRRQYPITEIVREFTTPNSGWVWNYTYILESMERFFTPKNLVIELLHKDFSEQSRQNPNEWKKVVSWNYQYRYEKMSDRLLERLKNALQNGKTGEIIHPPPYNIPVKTSLKVKPRPQPGDPPPSPPGVRLVGTTREEITHILQQARKLNLLIKVQNFDEFPEYLEIPVGRGRIIELLHEQTPGLKLPTGQVTLAIDVPLGEISTVTEMYLFSVVKYIFYITPRLKPYATPSIDVKGTNPVYICIQFRGISSVVQRQMQLYVATLAQLILHPNKLDHNSIWETVKKRLHEELRTSAGPFSLGLFPAYAIASPSFRSPHQLSDFFNDGKRTLSNAIRLLRLALVSSNPRLIVTGDFTRQEAAIMARNIGTILPFYNVPDRYLPRHRVLQWPDASTRLVLKLNNTLPGNDYTYFTPSLMIPVGKRTDCREGVFRELLFNIWIRYGFPRVKYIENYYRCERGMCYSAHGFLVAADRQADSETYAAPILSNSHSGLEMALDYTNFKESLRNSLKNMSDEELRIQLSTYSKTLLNSVSESKIRDFWRFHYLVTGQFDLARPVHCGLRAAEGLNDLKSFRKKLLETFDKYVSFKSPMTRETFVILERPMKLREKVVQLNTASTKLMSKVKKYQKWKPLVCEGEEIWSWITAKLKLGPSSPETNKADTQKLYRSLYGQRE